MTGQNSYLWKILEFQAKGLGFRNFAWLGSNPCYAPVIYDSGIGSAFTADFETKTLGEVADHKGCTWGQKVRLWV